MLFSKFIYKINYALFITLLGLIGVHYGFATHVRAGDLTARTVSNDGLTYEIRVVLYRDTDGIEGNHLRSIQATAPRQSQSSHFQSALSTVIQPKFSFTKRHIPLPLLAATMSVF